MVSIWTLVRFLHVTAAILWVGGQLTLSLVVRHAAKATLTDDARHDLFTEAGTRFARLATLALMPTLLGTGIALAWHRGVTFGGLTRPGYGAVLGTKIALALISFVLAAIHGMAAARSGSAAGRWVGMVGALVSVAVVLLATSFVP